MQEEKQNTETKKPQNPSAFPAWDMTFTENPNSNLFSAGTNQGMTLRDYFANSAMQGILSGDEISRAGRKTSEQIAERSYSLADAMLKQREIQNL